MPKGTRGILERDIIEAQLSHVVKDKHGGAYHRAKFLGERIEMMQTWANYCNQIKVGNYGYIDKDRPGKLSTAQDRLAAMLATARQKNEPEQPKALDISQGLFLSRTVSSSHLTQNDARRPGGPHYAQTFPCLVTLSRPRRPFLGRRSVVVRSVAGFRGRRTN